MLLRRLLLPAAACLALVSCSEDTATGTYHGAYGDMDLQLATVKLAVSRSPAVPTSLDTGICVTGTPDSFRVTLTEIVVAGMFVEKPANGTEEKEIYDNYVMWRGEKPLALGAGAIGVEGADSLPRGTVQNVILRFKSGAKVKGSVYRARVAVDTVKKPYKDVADQVLVDTNQYSRTDRDTSVWRRPCRDTLTGTCSDTMYAAKRVYTPRPGTSGLKTVYYGDTTIVVRSLYVDIVSTKAAYWYSAARDTGGADSASRFRGAAAEWSDIYLRSSYGDLAVSLPCTVSVTSSASLTVRMDLSRTLTFYNGAIPKAGQTFSGNPEDVKGKAYFFCHTLFSSAFKKVDSTGR